MSRSTGFIEYERLDKAFEEPLKRIGHFKGFHSPLPAEEQRVQASRCMDCGVPFCQSGMEIGGMVSGCPLNNLIPEWNDLIYEGNIKAAYYRLISTNNFPEFTGRVCPALCEAACTCNIPAKPVTIRDNEQSVIEECFEKGWIKPMHISTRTGKRVAVIGSGPSGLAAADLLNKRGHQVTVFERSDRPGGLLMYGIPNMKLEKTIVKRRTDLMECEGVEFKTGVDVGVTVSTKELLNQFDAVLLACGASRPRDILVPGRDCKGIYFAVDYLSKVTKRLLDTDFADCLSDEAKGKPVLVIGGGDTGNDCVGTAIRQGASSVIQLEMMPKLPDQRTEDNPWPQWPRVCKTDYGQEEAIALFGSDPRRYQTTVKEFIKDEQGKVKQAVLVSLESKMDEQSGRPKMSAVEGSEETVPVELVLIAAGFLGAEDYIAESFGITMNSRGGLEACVYQTKVDQVFTAGDVRRGQSLVVWAIREGREAARAIDEYLMGYSNL